MPTHLGLTLACPCGEPLSACLAEGWAVGLGLCRLRLGSLSRPSAQTDSPTWASRVDC